MADDILDGSKIVEYQDDSLTEDGLLIRETCMHANLVCQPGDKKPHAQRIKPQCTSLT